MVACVCIGGVMVTGGGVIGENEIVGKICGTEVMDRDWGDSAVIGDDCCAGLSVVPSSRLWIPSPKIVPAWSGFPRG